MVVLHFTSHISTVRFFPPHPSTSPLRRRFLQLRSAVSSSLLPSPIEKAEYHREVEAAINAVERACHLCVDVKKTLFTSGDLILKKDDTTPVTVVDFGVQALVSLELSKLFPNIPLVAEEDSAAKRSSYLADLVLEAVSSKSSSEENKLTKVDVFNAIDRGGKNAVSFGTQPATYWVLDPLDGTHGFQNKKSLYTCLCKYTMAALGKASVFILETKRTQKAWDHAVGMICVHEAGGKATDWKGNEIDHAADVSERRMIFPSGGVFVTNGNIHDTMLDMIVSGSSINWLSHNKC